MPLIKRKPTQVKGPSSPDAIALRRIMREWDPKRLGSGTISLPDEDTAGERQHFLFYQDEGGLRATDEVNEGMDKIYYLGIIDIAQEARAFLEGPLGGSGESCAWCCVSVLGLLNRDLVVCLVA